MHHRRRSERTAGGGAIGGVFESRVRTARFGGVRATPTAGRAATGGTADAKSDGRDGRRNAGRRNAGDDPPQGSSVGGAPRSMANS